MTIGEGKSVILFDGVCNLCNATVQFIIKRDNHDSFRFAALKSQFALQVLANFSNQRTYDSVLLFENGKLYSESDAALRITRKLKGLWPLLFILIVVPSPIRNGVYRLIARNRYKWFGRQPKCMIPSGGLPQKFLH